MPKLLTRIEQRQLEGIDPSRPHLQGRLWKDGSNVIFSEDSVQPIHGQFQLFEKPNSQKVIEILEQCVAGVDTVFWATDSSFLYWDAVSGSVSLSGALSTGIDGYASIQRWGDWTTFTNNVDAPQIVKSGVMAALGGSPPATCKFLVPIAVHLVAISTDADDQWIEWSDTDNPESWVVGAGSAAGNLPIREIECPPKAHASLSNAELIYGADSVHAIQYVNYPYYFGIQRVLTGIGVLGPKAVVRVGRRHFGMGPRGIWTHDGVSPQYFDTPDMHHYVYKDINLDFGHNVVAWYDKTNQHVVFFYPSGSSEENDRAIAFHFQTNVWTKWDLARSAASEQGIFPYGLLGKTSGEIIAQQIEGLDGGTVAGSPMRTSAVGTLEYGVGETGVGQLQFGGTETMDG